MSLPSCVMESGWVIWLGVGLGFLVGLELLRPGFRSNLRGPRLKRNLLFLLASLLTITVVQTLSHRIRLNVQPSLDWSAFPGLEVVACVLAGELLGWTSHFLKHRVSSLWSFHFQHHREQAYDVWLTTHTHGLEVIISGTIMALVLSWLGFSARACQTYMIFYALGNTYQHISYDISLGWLDWLVVGPRYHRLHHAPYSQVNYGNTLTVWDIVFRTACWPSKNAPLTQEIGVSDDSELPFGFWPEMTHFLHSGPTPLSEIESEWRDDAPTAEASKA